jgi:hydroxymethylbilane synthase
VFTREIQRSLLAGQVDVAVHSLKDLPTEAVAGLTLAAVPPRESPADVLVVRTVQRGAMPITKHDGPGDLLPPTLYPLLSFAARVGTGSLRRRAQLAHVRPDLRFVDVRGNVDTRLRKLDEGQFDALVLAEAGLARLGRADCISQILPPSLMMPAVGQGALALECRTDDIGTQTAIGPLDDATTRAAVLAERSLLAHLRGGCLAPIGAWGRVEAGRLVLSAVVLSADGARRLTADGSHTMADAADAESLGRSVADSLLAQGAADLIAAIRKA